MHKTYLMFAGQLRHQFWLVHLLQLLLVDLRPHQSLRLRLRHATVSWPRPQLTESQKRPIVMRTGPFLVQLRQLRRNDSPLHRYLRPRPQRIDQATNKGSASPSSQETSANTSCYIRYHQEKYHYQSPNQSSDRFYQYSSKQDRYHISGGASPTPSGGYYQAVNNGEQRFSEGQRYIPPHAHMPVERSVFFKWFSD